MVSGNSFASIHLLDHSGDHCLHRKELEKQLGQRLPDLLSEKAVDFVVYRDEKPGIFHVRNQDGSALVKANGLSFSYLPLTSDPFRLGGELEAPCHRGSLELTQETDYPDAVVQVAQLFRSRRAGDMIVTARNGYDYAAFGNTRSTKGSHGALAREHMLVPLIYNQRTGPFTQQEQLTFTQPS
jgi:hypothetical protein